MEEILSGDVGYLKAICRYGNVPWERQLRLLIAGDLLGFIWQFP